MPKLDLFVRNMWRFNANGVVLSSGSNVVMRLPSGDRFAAQDTPHAALVAMVEEVAPVATLATLRHGVPAEFPYSVSGGSVIVQVQPQGRVWRVDIVPAGPAPEAAAPRHTPPPGVAGPTPAPSPRPETPAAPPETMAPSFNPPPVHAVAAARPATPVAAPAAAIPAPGSGRPAVPAVDVVTPSVIVPQPPPAPGAVVLAKRGKRGTGSDSRTPQKRATGPQRAVNIAHAATASSIAAVASKEDLKVMERLLRKMSEARGSDLHLTTSAPPSVRVDGSIRLIEGEESLTAQALAAAVQSIAPEQNRVEFAARNDTDFAYEIPGLARFRVNLFMDRRGPAAVVRSIPFELRRPADLGLSEQVIELCQLHKGLVLVTGATGSGKSTTLAAMIDHANQTRTDHIITIEDPIEFVHESKGCLVHQREVGRHTNTFKDALRAALREDPDVLLVGELRDLETVAMAVETAETGHLVFGTLHTSTAPSTVDRIIDQFPSDRQEQIRQMLSESLRGVITQALCKRIGGGRVAAYEVLFNTGAVANLIRERKTFQIPSVMQTARGLGMVTLNDSLIDLVRKKLIEPREALNKSQNKTELRTLLSRDGFKVEAAA